MSSKRTIEILSAGCALCSSTLELVKQIACASCEVRVVDVTTGEGARRARELGAERVPAVAVDGVLLSCCEAGGVTEAALRSAGVGTA